MPLVLGGATSGSTTLTPTDAVTATITLPNLTSTLLGVAVAGTANQKLFTNAAGTASEFAIGMKVVSLAINTATATGAFSITGVGFKPSAVVAAFSGAVGTGDTSFGFADASSSVCVLTKAGGGSTNFASLLYDFQSAGVAYSAVLTTFDSDGLTLTGTKIGAASGTAQLYVLCFR